MEVEKESKKERKKTKKEVAKRKMGQLNSNILEGTLFYLKCSRERGEGRY